MFCVNITPSNENAWTYLIEEEVRGLAGACKASLSNIYGVIFLSCSHSFFHNVSSPCLPFPGSNWCTPYKMCYVYEMLKSVKYFPVCLSYLPLFKVTRVMQQYKEPNT